MEQELIEVLKNMQLMEEEEFQILISKEDEAQVIEECSLSLMRKLLTDRKQNLCALRNTLRIVWKIGQDLKIVEVGNDIFQFKFASKFQLRWVETNGLRNFENNLLLLKRWERGMMANNITFTHSPFWVQIWGLPFDIMTEKIKKEIEAIWGSLWQRMLDHGC